MGDSFLIMVTVTPVNCELDDTQIGMALGGGLTGDGLHQIGYNYGADTPISIRVGAQAVQAGTWTYTAVAGGWSYGTVDPQDGSCATDARGGWRCYRSNQANLTITIAGPTDVTPGSTSRTRQSGSSGGSQGQVGGTGSAQAASATTPVSPHAVAAFGSTRAVGSGSSVSPLLLIALAALVVVLGVLGVLLIRKWIAATSEVGDR